METKTKIEYTHYVQLYQLTQVIHVMYYELGWIPSWVMGQLNSSVLDLHPLSRASTLLVPLLDVTTQVHLQSHTHPIFLYGGSIIKI